MDLQDLQHPFILRSLQPSDFHKGYLQLMEQLTKVGDVSEAAFTKRVEELQNLRDYHRTAVIEDLDRKLIVATGSLLIELKFARNCGKAGHIEDVVVDQSIRGQHLGQSTCHQDDASFGTRVFVDMSSILERVIGNLTKVAKELGCYKVILDCTEENAPFYRKCGFHQKELQMAHYF